MVESVNRIRDQRIRNRAYWIWKEEGCPQGRALNHWVMAKSEVVQDLNGRIWERVVAKMRLAKRAEGLAEDQAKEFPEEQMNEFHRAAAQETDEEDLEIARRAHEIWERAGRPEGLADEHWHQAVQQIANERLTR